MKVRKKRKEAEREGEEASAAMVSQGAPGPPRVKVLSGAGGSFSDAVGIYPC